MRPVKKRLSDLSDPCVVQAPTSSRQVTARAQEATDLDDGEKLGEASASSQHVSSEVPPCQGCQAMSDLTEWLGQQDDSPQEEFWQVLPDRV